MTISFIAKKRDGQADDLRAEGQVPGILYGVGSEPVSLSADYNSFWKLYSEAGASTLVDLVIEDTATKAQSKPEKILIQDVQFDPVKHRVSHFDLLRINMNKEMHATIELNFVGEAPAVKELSGTLVKAQDTLDIKCLPKDLVTGIEVDLSVLKTFDDAIHVKDLILPAGITSVEVGDQMLVKVAAPLTEEELKAMEEEVAPAIDQIEVEKKGKEEVEPDSASGEATTGKGEADKKE